MSRFFAALEHIDFGGGIISLKTLIWGIWGGISAGALLSFYHKSYLGRVVRALLNKEALSKENAFTLGELGIKPRRLLTTALKEDATLRKVIGVSNPEECEFEQQRKTPTWLSKLFPVGKKYSYDFDKMKLYIPEEKRVTAEIKYDQKKKISPVVLVVFLAVLTGVAIGMTFVVPDLLQLLDNFIDMLSN
ncbi:MAG: hypothetical protein IJS45_08155 [Clostridia bacterium]|nr:hypothetical protein [Clostridia bacterium]